ILSGLPMMPVVKGDDSTRLQILVYAFILVAVSLTLGFFGAGWIYLTAAVILGSVFILRSYNLYKAKNDKQARALFGYSLIYLFGLFAAIMMDGIF
ncbi:MAG: UbiA family prenyltransferase, partial [Candidatus Zixiibacteriota bacterium]